MSLKLINKLSDKDRNSLKNGVFEVTGKAMNRTALGIVDAMINLYPKATFEELKEMLPDTLNPSAPVITRVYSNLTAIVIMVLFSL